MQKNKKIVIYSGIGIAIILALFGGNMFNNNEGNTSTLKNTPTTSVAIIKGEVKKSEVSPQQDSTPINYARILDLFRGKDVEKISTSKKIFALTFDGGGDAKGTKTILDILARHKITATFFLTGHFIEAFPDIVQAIQKSGGEIANHTMDHKDLSKILPEEIIMQISNMEKAAKEKEISVVPFFRFPYGAPTKEAIKIVNEKGYTSVRWTVDSLGWQGSKDGRTAQFVAERVIQKAKPGGIALMHLGMAQDKTTYDADALEQIITMLTGQGYQLVSLSQLFNEVIQNTAL